MVSAMDAHMEKVNHDLEFYIGNQEYVVLTPRLVHACETPDGGFSNATLRSLGVSQKDKTRGWIGRLRGKTIHRDFFRDALIGRYVLKSGGLG